MLHELNIFEIKKTILKYKVHFGSNGKIIKWLNCCLSHKTKDGKIKSALNWDRYPTYSSRVMRDLLFSHICEQRFYFRPHEILSVA